MNIWNRGTGTQSQPFDLSQCSPTELIGSSAASWTKEPSFSGPDSFFLGHVNSCVGLVVRGVFRYPHQVLWLKLSAPAIALPGNAFLQMSARLPLSLPCVSTQMSPQQKDTPDDITSNNSPPYLLHPTYSPSTFPICLPQLCSSPWYLSHLTYWILVIDSPPPQKGILCKGKEFFCRATSLMLKSST